MLAAAAAAAVVVVVVMTHITLRGMICSGVCFSSKIFKQRDQASTAASTKKTIPRTSRQGYPEECIRQLVYYEGFFES